MTNATNGTTGETFALETRAEELTYVSGDRRVRRGESDRLEVGSGPSQDAVSGTEHTRIGGQLSEHTGGNLSTQVSRMETTVEGKLTLRLKSDTTLLGGAMTDVHTGGVFIGAGMSDDMIIGGGVRVTAPADLWLCGLIGMEEKLGSAYADGALVELYRLAFEREYATGVHVAGAAVFSGTVHATMATGFRQLFKVSTGVRDLTPGGNAEGGAAPAPRAAPPPVEEAGASGALLGPSAVGMDEVDELAALEDIRYLFGDLDTTVDSGRPGNRAAVLEDLESVAKFSATGEDVGNTRALMNHLQEGAGLSDLVDGEDLRAMLLPLDENPGTLDEARMVPDERLDGQWPDRNWVESPCIDPVEPEVRFEHPLGMDHPPERRQFGPPRAAPGVPEDFAFERARRYFNWRCNTEFRPRSVFNTTNIPGTSEMNAARAYVDDLIFAHAQILPPEWVVDFGLSADELERFANDSLFAYRTMTDMEASARRSGDIAKADYLRGALNNIDVKSYYAYQKATGNAQALRDAARNSHLPKTVDRAALLDALDRKIALTDAKIEVLKLPPTGVGPLDPALTASMYIFEQKVGLYQTVRDAVAAGKDPVLYLDECVRLAADASDVSLAQFEAIIKTQAELMEMFSNPVYDFPVDVNVGGLRSALGVDDFDMSRAVTELSARIEVYGFDSTPGTTVLLDAFDRANGRALAQLEDLPDEYLARAGLADDSGTLSADVRRAIQDDPESAYRILTKMEADARTRSLELLDQAAGQEALEMADYLAAVIAVLDREAMSGFERALEAAEALRSADNIRLANDVNQPVLVRVIQMRLSALDARRVTLDLNDANALAQLEAEYAFLTGALRRVEEGYDPGPRLCEMVLIAQDRVIEMVLIEHDRVIWRGGDASELANIEAAYRNVLEVLVNYPVSVVDMPSIDDVRPPGVGASNPTRYPGKELTDDSDLGRINLSLLGSSEGARNLALFTDTQDAVHFDTARAALKRQLDISLHQLSLENPIWIDELVPPPPKRPKQPR